MNIDTFRTRLLDLFIPLFVSVFLLQCIHQAYTCNNM